MRITSANAFENSLANLQRRQAQLSDTQERLTSGKRVTRASDDPAAAARAERALAAMQRAESAQRALEASRNSMNLAESALGQAGDLLQQAREIMVGAGNASYSDQERATLADSLRGIRNQLFAIANRSDGAVGYLFGGQGSSAPPFQNMADGSVRFSGVDGAMRVASDDALPLSIDGQAAWLAVPSPVAGNPPLSVFGVLDRLAAQLSTPGRSSDDITTGVHDGIRDLDAVSGSLQTWRARAGEALKLADSAEERIAQEKLAAQTQRSNAEDLDMVQAISDFQNRQTSYDAALKTYSMVQRMSLFQYLGN